jgi:hypothetical protein
MGSVVVYTQFLVGQVCDVACPVIQLGDVRDRDVTQVLGGTVEVTWQVVGHLVMPVVGSVDDLPLPMSPCSRTVRWWPVSFYKADALVKAECVHLMCLVHCSLHLVVGF